MGAPESPREARRRLSASLSSRSFWRSLDRTQELGNDDDYGHTGCVNSLSWSSDGRTLVSGGDDRTICFWKPDDETGELVLRSQIRTGHTANIFNAQFLPDSSLIATCAGDSEVRVFDIEKARGDAGLGRSSNGRTWDISQDEPRLRVFRCHSRRTKRIVPESASHFLSVSQDGTVRQHDLRTPHTCRTGCPPPLVKVPHQLFTIARSSLTPFYFAVAGSCAYGHLFDRRMIPRLLKEEWGVKPHPNEVAQAVRRFGRRIVPPYEKARDAHVTGSRMAESNGHELLLSYSGDAIYLYSIYDDVEDTSFAPKGSNILPRSPKRRRTEETKDRPSPPRRSPAPLSPPTTTSIPRPEAEEEEEDIYPEDIEGWAEAMDIELDEDDDGDDGYFTDGDEALEAENQTMSNLKNDLDSLCTIMPRRFFKGICNVETVKDVNFVGPNDDFVASGSDDGSFFIWDKKTTELQGIYEGDGSVVNVIEQHPFLPMVAVSGIDTTVKIFSPVPSDAPRRYSRTSLADSIVRENTERAASQASMPTVSLTDIIRQVYAARGGNISLLDGDPDRECQIQ